MELEAIDLVSTATFRPGDVVLLRMRDSLTEETWVRLRDHFAMLREKTGVEFVLLDHSIDVIVPMAVGEIEAELPEMGQPEFKQPS